MKSNKRMTIPRSFSSEMNDEKSSSRTTSWEEQAISWVDFGVGYAVAYGPWNSKKVGSEGPCDIMRELTKSQFWKGGRRTNSQSVGCIKFSRRKANEIKQMQKYWTWFQKIILKEEKCLCKLIQRIHCNWISLAQDKVQKIKLSVTRIHSKFHQHRLPSHQLHLCLRIPIVFRKGCDFNWPVMEWVRLGNAKDSLCVGLFLGEKRHTASKRRNRRDRKSGIVREEGEDRGIEGYARGWER